jgi:hypothetical protein
LDFLNSLTNLLSWSKVSTIESDFEKHKWITYKNIIIINEKNIPDNKNHKNIQSLHQTDYETSLNSSRNDDIAIFICEGYETQ